jgi:hypothetical protein
VNLFSSTARTFDAPEFVLNLRHRHPTRGPRFALVFDTVSTLLFGPFSGTLRIPVTVVRHTVPAWTLFACLDAILGFNCQPGRHLGLLYKPGP